MTKKELIKHLDKFDDNEVLEVAVKNADGDIEWHSIESIDDPTEVGLSLIRLSEEPTWTTL